MYMYVRGEWSCIHMYVRVSILPVSMIFSNGYWNRVVLFLFCIWSIDRRYMYIFTFRRGGQGYDV